MILAYVLAAQVVVFAVTVTCTAWRRTAHGTSSTGDAAKTQDAGVRDETSALKEFFPKQLSQ